MNVEQEQQEQQEQQLFNQQIMNRMDDIERKLD
jgi:hypothetical protein